MGRLPRKINVMESLRVTKAYKKTQRYSQPLAFADIYYSCYASAFYLYINDITGANMKSFKNIKLIAAIAFSGTLIFLPAQSQAQMEVGVMGIYQNGKEVGKIYVPPRSPKDVTYAEHWVLYPDYIYPSKNIPGFETVIIPLKEGFSSLAEFQKNTRLEPGTRSIEVLSQETRTK